MSKNKEVNNIKKPKKQLKEEDENVVIVNDINKIQPIVDEKKVDNVVIKIEDKARRNKSSVFIKEREAVLKKVSDILGVKGDTYILDITSISDEKEKKIIELTEDMKKFFAAGNWGYFKETSGSKPIVALIKSLYKDMGYEVRQSATQKMTNGVKHITTNLIFLKK